MIALVISLLISPAALITPANPGNVWAPYGTVLAAYGPFYYHRDRSAAFAAVGTLTLIVARVWEPSASVIVIGVLRTAVGPLLALAAFSGASLCAALGKNAALVARRLCMEDTPFELVLAGPVRHAGATAAVLVALGAECIVLWAATVIALVASAT